MFATPVTGGCGGEPTVDLKVPERRFKPKHYPDVLERWTRHERIIQSFDTNLDVHITYLSPEFISAHAALYADHYKLSRAERKRYLARRLAEVETHHEFFMGATTADLSWNDFARKETIWRISLENDRGTRVKPLTIKRVRIRETHRVYFPYLSVFHRAYHLVFPKQVGSKPLITSTNRWFKLIIASPLGDVSLAWHIKPVKGPPRERPRRRRAKPSRPRAEPARLRTKPARRPTSEP
jgi:hypothetical protein